MHGSKSVDKIWLENWPKENFGKPMGTERCLITNDLFKKRLAPKKF